MPIETLDDLIDQISNWCNVYGAHSETCTEEKPCRNCFESELRTRIVAAVEVEQKLGKLGCLKR